MLTLNEKIAFFEASYINKNEVVTPKMITYLEYFTYRNLNLFINGKSEN